MNASSEDRNENPKEEKVEEEITESPQEEKSENSRQKMSETLENLKQNENIESLMNYAKNNVQDTVAYILMIFGILWMFFQWFYGGLLIGLVTGFYFSKELIHLIKFFNDFVEEQGVSRSLILGGLAVALFFSNPGIFIGIGIMVGLKVMLKQEN